MFKFMITQKMCIKITITPKKCCGKVYGNTKSVIVKSTITQKKCCGKLYYNTKKVLW